MWISKKKWQEMEDKVDKIDDMQKQLQALRDCHNMEKVKYSTIGSDLFPCYEYEYDCYHDVPKANTKTIPIVTFEELARFVIDSEPIKRKEEIDVEYRKG